MIRVPIQSRTDVGQQAGVHEPPPLRTHVVLAERYAAKIHELTSLYALGEIGQAEYHERAAATFRVAAGNGVHNAVVARLQCWAVIR